jgi:hypothetical protein
MPDVSERNLFFKPVRFLLDIFVVRGITFANNLKEPNYGRPWGGKPRASGLHP